MDPLGLFPHAHLRGKEYRLEPRRRCDFTWQMYYILTKPLAVPKGARLEVMRTLITPLTQGNVRIARNGGECRVNIETTRRNDRSSASQRLYGSGSAGNGGGVLPVR